VAARGFRTCDLKDTRHQTYH